MLKNVRKKKQISFLTSYIIILKKNSMIYFYFRVKCKQSCLIYCCVNLIYGNTVKYTEHLIAVSRIVCKYKPEETIQSGDNWDIH